MPSAYWNPGYRVASQPAYWWCLFWLLLPGRYSLSCYVSSLRYTCTGNTVTRAIARTFFFIAFLPELIEDMKSR